MTATEPTVDFTQIEFPSDKLTVKMLREAWPDAFDMDRLDELGRAPYRRYKRHAIDSILGESMIDLERMVAERAFKVALGQSVDNDSRISDKDDLIDGLAATYTRTGLARGEHEVMAMIRRIEVQAEAQARQHGSRGR
jgi:hypothetical protein